MAERDLQYYERQLRDKQRQLTEQRNMKEYYQSMAEEIGRVYEKLAAKKDEARGLRDDAKRFAAADYRDFRGTLFSKKYEPKVEDIYDEHKTLVGRIDTTLDDLNDERRRYENLAYQCDGMIGKLQSGINYLNRTIQNWVN